MTIRRLKKEVEERGFLAVGPNDLVSDVVSKMKESGVHDAVLVMDGEEMVGIVTTNDIAFRLVAEGKDPEKTKVISIMTAPVHDLAITPHASIEECRALMHMKRMRHLPLTEGGNVLGIVTSLDVADYRDNLEIQREMERASAMGKAT